MLVSKVGLKKPNLLGYETNFQLNLLLITTLTIMLTKLAQTLRKIP